MTTVCSEDRQGWSLLRVKLVRKMRHTRIEKYCCKALSRVCCLDVKSIFLLSLVSAPIVLPGPHAIKNIIHNLDNSYFNSLLWLQFVREAVCYLQLPWQLIGFINYLLIEYIYIYIYICLYKNFWRLPINWKSVDKCFRRLSTNWNRPATIVRRPWINWHCVSNRFQVSSPNWIY